MQNLKTVSFFVETKRGIGLAFEFAIIANTNFSLNYGDQFVSFHS